MNESTITLSVPAQPLFARSVRMMAANLAVVCSMSVDDVENARMAAEEAFIVACATNPSMCEITFTIDDEKLAMAFSLGGPIDKSDSQVAEQLGLAQVLITAVSDSFEISPDRLALQVSKVAGVANAY